MLYELRIYHMHPGRLPNICARFADHTLALFHKHGIQVTDFWIDAQGQNRIYYVCAFTDDETRQAAWSAFREDPEWIRARDESELDGPIVERVDSFPMTRAPFFTGQP